MYYIIRDEVHILGIIGAYIESLHSSKDADNANTTHTLKTRYFNWFLDEKKISKKIEKNHFTEFNEQIVATFDETRTKNFFTTSDQSIQVFWHLKATLSAEFDFVPNIVVKKLSLLIISKR